MADIPSKYRYLNRQSVEELENLLQLAVDVQSEDEDSEYVDAILKVIVEKEREHPSGRISDVDQAWNDFQTYYNTDDGRDESLYFTEESITDQPQELQGSMLKFTPMRNLLRKTFRIAVIAAVVMACTLGGMVVAQASGVDVFGAIARWSEAVFSFGEVQPDNITYVVDADETLSEAELEIIRREGIKKDTSTKPPKVVATLQRGEFLSVQDALDVYDVMEVKEPAYIPEGFTLNHIDVMQTDDPASLSLGVSYVKEDVGGFLDIDIMSYDKVITTQVEKTDASVVDFEINGTTFYLMENINNYTIAWLTDHYECYLSAPISMDKETLYKITESMFD